MTDKLDDRSATLCGEAYSGADFMRWWRGDTEQFTAAYSSIGGARREPAVLSWAAREFGVPAE